jgi:hypothetical protein
VAQSPWRITPPATTSPAPSRPPRAQDIHARRALGPPGPGFSVALRAFRKSRCVGQGPARGYRSAQRQPKRVAASQSTARASAPYGHRICPPRVSAGVPELLLSHASERLPRGSRGARMSSKASARSTSSRQLPSSTSSTPSLRSCSSSAATACVERFVMPASGRRAGSWSRKGIRLRHPAAELCTGQIDGHVLDQPARSLVPGWILMHCRSGYARADMRRVAQPHAAAEAKPGGDRGYPAPHRWRSRQSVRRMRTSPIRRPSSPPPGSSS